MIKKFHGVNKISILNILILLLSLSVLLTTFTEAAYVSNSLKSRYVYDTENEESYVPLIYEVKYEQKINTENLFGKLYLNPIFTYNLDDEEKDMDLGEGYIELYFPHFDFRAGKQKLTWGKSDGFAVTNIINPQDYTVNPVIEYEDQFQAVNALKANFYPGPGNLEIVWIPEFKKAVIDERMMNNSKPPGWTIDVSNKKVENGLENSELLLHYSSLGQNYDYEIMAGYVWADLPTMHKDPLQTKILHEYHRLTVGGGSISAMKGPFVFRGEGAYISGKYFNSEDFMEYSEGVVEKNEFKWLAGIDYNYEGYLFSTQFLQEAILDYEESIVNDEYTNQMTFLIQKNFLRNILNTELNFYYNLNEEILKVRPAVSYDYSDNISFKAGGNFTIEGQGVKDDVVYVQSEYMF